MQNTDYLSGAAGGLIVRGLAVLRLQKTVGWLAMLLMVSGFLVLVDGLVAEMQRGPNRLDVIPDTVTPLSGPIPVKKAEIEDFFVVGNAPDGQVRLILDTFFTSYWFGSGMWRGRLVVGPNPGIGEYPFIVEFRNAPPKAAQQYRVVVWYDTEAMRTASFSYIMRETGLSPFVAATVVLLCGIVMCVINFLLGRVWQRKLSEQGLAEVYRIVPMKEAHGLEATFGLGTAQGLRVGQRCTVFTLDGHILWQGPVAFCEPRHASVLLPDTVQVTPASLVRAERAPTV